MTHTYAVKGMTCGNCQATVKKALSAVPGVKDVSIDLAKGEATIIMGNHIPTTSFKSALKSYSKFSIEEKVEEVIKERNHNESNETSSWLVSYKPLILVFAYLLGATLLIETVSGSFNVMRWMRHVMAGFFLTFSFFKFLDLRGFAESYFSYDIIARKWFNWGYIYAFIELLLGIAFLINFNPLVTNTITLIVMSLSIVGVVKSVLQKRKIKCACLGAVFNLPMSTVTIVEDAAMIVMALITIIHLV
jgi:copper chaperone CopZ